MYAAYFIYRAVFKVHVRASTSFLVIAESICSIAWNILFINLLVLIWVVATLAIMNNAAVDINVQVFVWMNVFVSLGVELAGLYGDCSTIRAIAGPVSQAIAPLDILLHILVSVCPFASSCPRGYEVGSHCGCEWHFSDGGCH